MSFGELAIATDLEPGVLLLGGIGIVGSGKRHIFQGFGGPDSTPGGRWKLFGPESPVNIGILRLRKCFAFAKHLLRSG